MNEAQMFYTAIIVFGIVYIILALLPRKHIATTTGYFLAGRNLGILKATCTLIATQLGAGLLLGTSQQAYHIGLYGLFFTGGISLGLILLGCGVASRLRSLEIMTTTQIFAKKYFSPTLQKIASLMVTITLSGILVGNMVASKTLMLSLGFDSGMFYLIFWLFIILYTMIGGLHAVVLTDLFQVMFITVIFVGIALYSLLAFPHSFSLSALSAVQHQFTGQLPSTHILFIMVLMPALFALFEQDLAQIFFASKTKRVATWAALLATIFMITFGLIPIYLGMQAKVMGLSVLSGQSPLFVFIRSIAPPFIMVMVATGILAAIASTADALLCAIGANITQDFSLSCLGLTPLVESKATIFIMGFVIFGFSYIMPHDIIHILIKSYELPVYCLLIPIVAAYLFKHVRRYAGYGGVLGGAVGILLFKFLFNEPFESFGPFGLSLIGYLIGHFVEGKAVQEADYPSVPTPVGKVKA